MKTLIEKYETNQCLVEVFETDIILENHKVYIIRSIHKNNYKQLIRFGTRQQIDSIIRSYIIEKRFEL